MLGMFVELSERYCVEFDTAGLNLYRDGSDSVAWHGDRIESRAQEPVVAIVSLGNPRPFRMRPRGGGRSATWVLQPGDLFVMGGACQQHFDHSVPKIRTCGPRISVTFRHRDGPTIRGRRYSSPASTDVKVNKANGRATVTLTRTGDTIGSATVDFITQDDTANQRSDYSPVFGSVTFAPGETSKTITIPLINHGYGTTAFGAQRSIFIW